MNGSQARDFRRTPFSGPMFNYDFHIHTELCGHAPGQTIEKILTRADELGLEAIAITEHVFTPDDLRLIDKIRTRVKRYPTSCRVIIGAEVDTDRNFFDGRLGLDNRYNIDYIIGTIHYLPGTNVMPHCQPERPLSPDETFNRWRSTLLGLAGNALIDTLAHPGAMIANALPDNGFPQRVLDVFAEAARICAKTGIMWELNNLTAKKLTETQQQQYHRILQIALDAGVALIYGSDAHNPQNICNTSFVSQITPKLSDRHCLGNGVELMQNILSSQKNNNRGFSL